MRTRRLSLVLLLSLGAQARAGIIESTPAHLSLQYTLEVRASPVATYATLVDVAHWWDPAHSYSGKAANLHLDARAGGCWCEKLPGGGSVRHMTVVVAWPGRQLRLNGALGPLQDGNVSGNMNWALEPAPDGGTRITLSYLVDGFYPGGLNTLSGAVDHVLAAQLQRLRDRIEAVRGGQP